MDNEPTNRLPQDDADIYALNDQDVEFMRRVLALLRQIEIMMWAYRFDHARYTMQRLQQNYTPFLQRGRIARRERESYLRELSGQLELFELLLRRNQDIAIAGIASEVDFLATRLNMTEVKTQPDNSHFEYGLLQLEDNIITIRSYCFDEIIVTPSQYLAAFQEQQNFNLVVDQQVTDFPLGFRLFSNSYFAEIAVFDSDYAEIRLTSANQSEELINMLIRLLNSTRTTMQKNRHFISATVNLKKGIRYELTTWAYQKHTQHMNAKINLLNI